MLRQVSTLLNFAIKSSKGKILRPVKNFNGPFITSNSRFAADICNARPSGTLNLKMLDFQLQLLASVKRERRTRGKREKESAKLFSVVRSPG